MTTSTQIKLIRDSWFEIDPVQAARTFYIRFFELDPEAAKLFNIEEEGDPAKSAKIGKQGQVTFNYISWAVKNLEDTPAVLDSLDKLGERHIKYGTERAHFAPAGEALLYALEKHAGETWTSEAKEAWAALYGIITDRMSAKLP